MRNSQSRCFERPRRSRSQHSNPGGASYLSSPSVAQMLAAASIKVMDALFGFLARNDAEWTKRELLGRTWRRDWGMRTFRLFVRTARGSRLPRPITPGTNCLKAGGYPTPKAAKRQCLEMACYFDVPQIPEAVRFGLVSPRPGAAPCPPVRGPFCVPPSRGPSLSPRPARTPDPSPTDLRL